VGYVIISTAIVPALLKNGVQIDCPIKHFATSKLNVSLTKSIAVYRKGILTLIVFNTRERKSVLKIICVLK
jgi:hypothetical protein